MLVEYIDTENKWKNRRRRHHDLWKLREKNGRWRRF